MRIRSISLQGFKSFGNRTSLELSPRVNVIAGPNGSGKSNVIDGLRWATGGGRASEFRAGEKTELIFHGASGKRSLGFAEVEIELEGASGKVAVQRTLQRDGSGRLRLNGRNARFLDIDEALSGSGLGRGSLAIIGQGEISGVLMADPARLLAFVAEAAGVARLSGRREQAEARLARAQDHMLRLQDLQEEHRRQLQRLESEAADASRHAALSRESLSLRFTLAQNRVRSLEQDLQELGQSEQQLAASVKAQLEDQQILQEDLTERRQQVSARQEHYREATASFEVWRGEVRLRESRLEELRNRLATNHRQTGQLQQELGRLNELKAPDAPAEDDSPLVEAVSLQQQQLQELQSQRGELLAEETEARNALARLQNAARERELQAGRLQERRDALSEQLQENALRLESAEQSGLEQDPSDSRLAEVNSRLTATAARLEELRGELAQAQEQHAHNLADARSLETTVSRLRASIEARSGFAEGPRLALRSQLPGIKGAVADLFQLQPEHRSALAAALGNRSEYVVVDTAENGQLLIRHIREQGAFITVLPLDLVRGQRLAFRPQHLNARGVLGPLIEQISFDRRFEALFSQLLGSTLLVRTMDDAVQLARTQPDRPRLVTLDGELLDRGGAMSGGRRNASAGVLGQAQELEQLETDAVAAEERSQESQQKLTELQQLVRDTVAALRQLEVQQSELARLEAARRERAAIHDHLMQDLKARRQELQAELQRLDGTELPAEVPAAELDAAAALVADLGARLESLAERISKAAADQQQVRGQLALQEERLLSHKAALARFEQDTARREALTVQLTELRQQSADTEKELLEADESFRQLRQNPPVDLESMGEELNVARQQLTSAEQRLAGLGTELSGHKEQLERTRLSLARRETLLENALADAGQFPPGLEVTEGSERNMRSRLQQVSSELEELGPVNHRAAAEFQQEQLRHHQLAADLLDAESAAAELQESLEEVDREVTSRSEVAISRVREAFVTHVQELFGAEAESAIETIREEGRPAGLSIRLQPPGKRTTQLNLLSVGERTMGALAFLFALMDGSDSSGLPIAVLDEVDAPLDEANISRFTTFVERLAGRGTQFLLISHQKTTFSVADAMWGVTSDRGVSSVFSISRSHEAEAAPELTLGKGER